MPGLNIFGLADNGGNDPFNPFPGPEIPRQTQNPPPVINPALPHGGKGPQSPTQDCSHCIRPSAQIACSPGPSGDACRASKQQAALDQANCMAACQGAIRQQPDTGVTPGGQPAPPSGGGPSAPGGPNLDFGSFGAFLEQLQQGQGFAQNPLLQQLQAFLSTELEGPFGIDPRVISQQRNIITGSGAQREQQALQNLQASLNTVGQVGGGRQIQLGREISEGVGREVSGGLTNLAQMDALAAQGDRDAIVGQILGFGGLLGQEGSQDLTRLLGGGDLALRQALGQGSLDLGFGQLGLGFGQLDLQRLLGLIAASQNQNQLNLANTGLGI